VRHHSSKKSQHSAADDAIPTQTRQDDIQLGPTQYGPEADHYDTLNPSAQGEQSQQIPGDAELCYTQHGPVAGHYEKLIPQTKEEQNQPDLPSQPQKKNTADYVNLKQRVH